MDHPSLGRGAGYSGGSYDRYVERNDDTSVSKMQQHYWEVKQTFLSKIRRKEDNHVVASDAELDTKLELFKSIQETCLRLLCILEGYQDRLCGLAHEESATGRFLKDCGKMDKTRAGKMLTASGKTLCYTAQQRIQLRNPLVRLYQEVETFEYRAIADTYLTIEKMEKSRTAYRAALLWMKDVSEKLDPDTFKQLEKFRKVQGHVRRTKTRFDKLKVDAMQKIDLLCASRVNMLSHALVAYQNALMTFWEKTSKTQNAVADSFKGYQHYEFTMLKELTETSKRLAQDKPPQVPQQRQQQKDEEEDDGLDKIFGDDEDDKDKLIFFESEYKDRLDRREGTQGVNSIRKATNAKQDKSETTDASGGALLDLGSSNDQQTNGSGLLSGMTNRGQRADGKGPKRPELKDILTPNDLEADELAILNDILNAPSVPPVPPTLSESQQKPSMLSSDQPSSFMLPSQLLDLNDVFQTPTQPINPSPSTSANPNILSSLIGDKKPTNAKGSDGKSNAGASSQQPKTELDKWLNLFADLDPLGNPDAIGKKGNDFEDRNC